MTYKNLSPATSALTFTLFLSLLFYPSLIFWIFSVSENESADFLARRAAMLFLGLSIITYLGRKAPPSELRGAICFGIAASMLGLAGLGVYEYARGFAGPGIFLAVSTELIFALSYLWIGSTSNS